MVLPQACLVIAEMRADNRRVHPSRTRPPGEALAWVERTIGRGARVLGWRRLTGGISSSVHRLTVEHNGRREPFVLRRWVPGEHGDNAAGALASETAILTALERSDVGRWPKGLFRRSFFRGYASMIGVPVDEACEAFSRLFPDEEIVAPVTVVAPPPGMNVKIKTRWWH